MHTVHLNNVTPEAESVEFFAAALGIMFSVD